jgi:hypothetical protein
VVRLKGAESGLRRMVVRIEGALTSCVGTTTITGTAASALALQRSAMPATIARSRRHVMRCTRRHESFARLDGHPMAPAMRRRSASACSMKRCVAALSWLSITPGLGAAGGHHRYRSPSAAWTFHQRGVHIERTAQAILDDRALFKTGLA